jgi:hypothetical protein
LGIRDAALLAAFVVVQALTGMVMWLLVTRGRPGVEVPDRLELLGMGLAIGSILAVISGVLVDAIFPGHLGWFLPSILALAAWLWPRRGSLHLVPTASDYAWVRPSLVAVVVTFVLGIASILINLSRYPLDWIGTWGDYHRDMLYFEALSTSVAVFGPGDSIFMSGADIRYHWFAYAWAGQLAHTADAVPFAMLTRVLPVVALIGSIALVTSWAARLTRRSSVTVLAGLLLISGGYLGAVNGTVLNFDSPSQALTTVWLLGFLVAVLAYLRGVGGTPMLGAIALLSAAMVGGKVSTGAVGLVPLVLLAVVAAVRRESWARRSWVAVGAAGAAAVVTYVVVISGSAGAGDLLLFSWLARASSVQGLNLSYSPVGIALGSVALIVAVMVRWAGLAWLLGDRAWRWRPDVVIGAGLVIVGVLPIVILSQGVNETWFALAASAPLAVLSAVGIGAVWERLQDRRAMWASAVCGGLVLAVVALIWARGSLATTSDRFWGPWVGYALACLGGVAVVLVAGKRRDRALKLVGSTLTILVIAGAGARAMPAVGNALHSAEPAAGLSEGSILDVAPGPVTTASEALLIGSPPDRSSWSQLEVDAARFLRNATGEADIVVTNETTSFVVPALTGRLTYLSGAPYQGLYGGKDSVAGIPQRIDTSLSFTRSADGQAFADLCAAGVTWAWIALDGTLLRNWEPYAQVEFENEAVAVARLDSGLCP